MAESTPARRQRSSNQTAHQTYGYHNTFHTHAQLPVGSPPAYARHNDNLAYLHAKARDEAAAEREDVLPPPYTCTVAMSGVLGVRHELLSPFHVSGQRDWSDCFVVLRGTQLRIHRAKQPGLWSKNKLPSAGRLISSYTLQHAEVGIAADFKKSPLTPKSPFAHLVPASARHKLYETDPHLFEPIREHAIRIRVETEQLLLCASSQEEMLDWTEALCAAIDISPPLEDRSEPRYRSLPRRNRRQRLLDGAHLADDLDNLSALDAGRRLIEQQERIIRDLFPHLQMGNLTSISATPDSLNNNTNTTTAPAPADEDFDPEDVRPPTSSSTSTSTTSTTSSKSTPPPPSPSQSLRYRRRCAPILLTTSPRVSDVLYTNTQRHRISIKDRALVPYAPHPPRYDVSNRLVVVGGGALEAPRALEKSVRPASPIRAGSEDSIASISFGFQGEAVLGKIGTAGRKTEAGEGGISAVALGVGLLV